MAFYRKLTEGWRLTDGILPEVLLEKPCPVYEALREYGDFPDAEEGMKALSCEWIAARTWVYSLQLEAPDEDDERILLELPCVSHAGSAYLNGELLDNFLSGSVRLDLTGVIRREETNRLEIRFPPRPHVRPETGLPIPEIGLIAAPLLRTVNFAMVQTMEITSSRIGGESLLAVEMTIDAYTAGRYDFRYAVTLDGELAGVFDFAEKLPAARRRVRHEIRIRNAVCFDEKRADETTYSVKFTMERGGIGCDVRHMETAFRKNMPMKCLAISAWPASEETIESLVSLGAQGILLAGAPDNRFEKNDFLGGLTVVEKVDVTATTGMLCAGDIKKYASGENFWPMENALWRLRGGTAPDVPVEEKDQAEKYALRVRYAQALAVRRAAERARRDKRAIAFPADEKYAFFASGSIIERSGKLRPAARALKKVWAETHIFPEITQRGQASIWALTEKLTGQALKALVIVMRPDGENLSETAFPVMGGDVRLVGVMQLPAAEETLIIRTILMNERCEVISRTDELAGKKPTMEETCITRTGGQMKNEGNCAAVSAEIILMPGEEVEEREVEWLNA